ncbi:hypothetical protein D3C80_1045620 [compost metagenome]
MLLSIVPTVTPELTVIPKPLPPFLVEIITTPFDAIDPYRAVAAAPFNTFTDSISSGFISAAALP